MKLVVTIVEQEGSKLLACCDSLDLVVTCNDIGVFLTTNAEGLKKEVAKPGVRLSQLLTAEHLLEPVFKLRSSSKGPVVIVHLSELIHMHGSRMGFHNDGIEVSTREHAFLFSHLELCPSLVDDLSSATLLSTSLANAKTSRKVPEAAGMQHLPVCPTSTSPSDQLTKNVWLCLEYSYLHSCLLFWQECIFWQEPSYFI